MYPGISTQVFGENRLCEKHIRAIGEAGFTAAEVYGLSPHFDLLNDNEVSEAAAYFKYAGVAVSAVHVPYKTTDQATGRKRRLTPTTDDAVVLALLKSYTIAGIKAARMLRAPLIVIHCGTYGDRMEGGTVSNALSFFSWLEPRLDGVKVAFENVATPVSEPYYMSYLFDIYSYDGFGVCFDAAHANFSPIGMELKGCESRIFHVHVSDNDGKKDLHKIPMDGSIDWRKVMKTLREIGYDGCINFEPRGVEPPEVLMKKCRTAYDRLIALD